MPEHQAQSLALRDLGDLGDAKRRGARAHFHAVVNQLQTMRRITALPADSDRPRPSRTRRAFTGT